MKSLTLESNGMLARLWKSTYNKDLPKSLCPYFWSSLAAIIIAIPAWPGHVINAFTKYKHDRVQAFWFAVHLPVFEVFGLIILKDIKPTCLGFLQLYGYGWLIMLGVAAIITVMMFMIYVIKSSSDYIKERLRSNKPSTPHDDDVTTYRPNIIVEYWKAFKGKYCPKINWKE